MTHFTQLRVFKEARKNISSVATLCDQISGFGDLLNQIKRSAISVASNVAEGSGSSNKKQFIKFLSIARASNDELHAQILILTDLYPKTNTAILLQNIIYVGKMLSKLIKYLNTT